MLLLDIKLPKTSNTNIVYAKQELRLISVWKCVLILVDFHASV